MVLTCGTILEMAAFRVSLPLDSAGVTWALGGKYPLVMVMVFRKNPVQMGSMCLKAAHAPKLYKGDTYVVPHNLPFQAGSTGRLA